MARGDLRLGRSQALGLIARVGIWAGSIAHRLPNHLNVVDDLNDACDPGNRFIGSSATNNSSRRLVVSWRNSEQVATSASGTLGIIFRRGNMPLPATRRLQE